jgi:hypothetical protein
VRSQSSDFSGIRTIASECFVHWGLYSLVGASEWVMFHDRYSISEYEKLVPQFRAESFNADELVRAALHAGLRSHEILISIASRNAASVNAGASNPCRPVGREFLARWRCVRAMRAAYGRRSCSLPGRPPFTLASGGCETRYAGLRLTGRP